MGAGAGGGHFRNEDRGGTDGKESLEEGWEQRELQLEPTRVCFNGSCRLSDEPDTHTPS